jgi:hypothetical protein
MTPRYSGIFHTSIYLLGQEQALYSKEIVTQYVYQTHAMYSLPDPDSTEVLHYLPIPR